MPQKQGAKPFDIDRWELYYAYKRVNQIEVVQVLIMSHLISIIVT